MKREVWPVLEQMLAERVALGQRKYGTRLHTHNGRRALLDLWEELADALFYLTQHLMELDEPNEPS